jgi:hypothetical protein
MTCLPKQYLPSVQFGGIVHFLQDQQVIASKGNTVFFSENGGSEWKKLLSFPLSLCDQLKCSNKISRRLFRSGVQHAIGINDNVFVFWAFGGIYNYVLKSNTLMRSITSFPGSRPLSLCHAGGGKLYFGEYRGNPERSPVHIFGSIDGGKVWLPVWEFTSIRHVHGVFHDPYTDYIWVTTGDEDQECGLWVTTNQFQTIERVVGGAQQTRAVQLLFTEKFIYFGSDTPLERNWIYRFNRSDLCIEQLQAVEGSVFYGCKVGTRLFFSTVCEPSRVNRPRAAVIWESSDGVAWHRFLNFPKDALPMKLFQYGQIRFPVGNGDGNSLWITPFATKYDQISMKFNFSE